MTEQEKSQAIVAAVKPGRSYQSIADEFGVTRDEVKRLVDEAGASENSGAGELSPEDKALLQGSKGETPPDHPAPEYKPMTAESVAEAMTAAGFESPLDLIKAIVSFGDRLDTLETAVESHAKILIPKPKARPDLPHVPPARDTSIDPATPEEETAYSQFNASAGERGEKPCDGILDWRARGRPGMAA